MIIIKNIILYFIQIRHTDDFPSTGTRLVLIILLMCFQHPELRLHGLLIHCDVLFCLHIILLISQTIYFVFVLIPLYSIVPTLLRTNK